jgi:hypothetical protein
MGNVHVVQLMCRARHCVLAALYRADKGKREVAEDGIREKLETEGYPWRCGICHDVNLHFQDDETPFDTVPEALPAFQCLQAERKLVQEKARASRVARNN